MKSLKQLMFFKINYSGVLGLVLISIFFFRQLWLGEVIYCCDNLTINLPARVFLIESLRRGEFPLWNPYILSGSPFLADLNLSLLSPFNLLYFFFSPFRALTWNIILSFVLALWGIMVFGKKIKLSQFASLLSAVIYTFSGTMVVYTNNLPMLQVAALLPWAAYACISFFEKPRLKSYLVLVAVLVLQLVAGHPQLTYYSWLFLGVYILFWAPPPLLKKLIMIILVWSMVAVLAAVQIMPFTELAKFSTRQNLGFSYASFDSLEPLALVRLILPNIVGNLRSGLVWAQGGSVYGYLGLISLIFVLAAFFSGRPWVKFLWLAALGAFILALGKFTPVFYFFYKTLPGLGSFRSPQHFLLLYTFSLALVAGFGADFLAKTNKRLNIGRWVIGIGVLFLVSGVLLLVILPFGQATAASLAKLWSTKALLKLSTLPPETGLKIFSGIAENFLISGLLILIAGIILRYARIFGHREKLLLVILIFFELFFFSRHNLISLNEIKVNKWFLANAPLRRRFTDLDWTNYRIYTSSNLYPWPDKKTSEEVDLPGESQWQIAILRPNINLWYRIPAIDGYASLIYRPYQEFFTAEVADPTRIDVGSLIFPKAQLLGIKYILASENEADSSLLKNFYAVGQEGEVVVYANPRPVSRLFFENPQNTNLVIEDYRPNQVRLHTVAPRPEKLIFADTNYPGWQALVDRKIVAISSYGNVFKSITVPSGEHEVKFVFWPTTIKVGLLLTSVGMVIYILLVIVAFYMKVG